MPKGNPKRNKRSRPNPPSRHTPARKTKKRALRAGSHGAKIDEYLVSHGLVRVPILGDGNCLFRALAEQIGLGEGAHEDVRRRVVGRILGEKEYFGNFIDVEEGESVEAYCDEMRKDGILLQGKGVMVGEWGGDIELEGFRREYGRSIVIYDASSGTPYVKPYDGDEGRRLNAVHLWKSDCHYESVRNKDGPFEGASRVVYKVCVSVSVLSRMWKCQRRMWRGLGRTMRMQW
jgi:OTU-like cysteine protease